MISYSSVPSLKQFLMRRQSAPPIKEDRYRNGRPREIRFKNDYDSPDNYTKASAEDMKKNGASRSRSSCRFGSSLPGKCRTCLSAFYRQGFYGRINTRSSVGARSFPEDLIMFLYLLLERPLLNSTIVIPSRAAAGAISIGLAIISGTVFQRTLPLALE